MKAVVFLATLFLAAAVPVPQGKPEGFVLPELHKIKTVTLSPSYGCRSREEFKRGYENTALFLTTLSRRRNTPELVFNGACGGPDELRSMTAGDDIGVIADLGDIPLEKVTPYVAFNTHNVDSFELYSKFTQVAKVQQNHTYAVLIDRSEIRSLFVFTVIGYLPNKKLDLRYAVKLYEVLQIRDHSPGFGWNTVNTADEAKK
jgi:hypothetical protein